MAHFFTYVWSAFNLFLIPIQFPDGILAKGIKSLKRLCYVKLDAYVNDPDLHELQPITRKQLYAIQREKKNNALAKIIVYVKVREPNW